MSLILLDVRPLARNWLAGQGTALAKRGHKSGSDVDARSQASRAVGRKIWLHVGSERAGPRVAAILSIVETCPATQYPGSQLPGLRPSGLSQLPD